MILPPPTLHLLSLFLGTAGGSCDMVKALFFFVALVLEVVFRASGMLGTYVVFIVFLKGGMA